VGISPEPTHYKLTFEQPALAGLEITTGPMSINQAMRLDEIWAAPAGTLAENAAQTREAIGIFADVLLSWNLDDPGGEPVPPTAEAMLAYRDQRVIMTILTEWRQAAIGVSGPLERPSPNGSGILEDSLPMEALSPSPAS
jgi:hypothetical protein